MQQGRLFNAFDAIGEIEALQDDVDGLARQVEENKDQRKELSLLLDRARRNLRIAIKDAADQRREARAPLTLTRLAAGDAAESADV